MSRREKGGLRPSTDSSLVKDFAESLCGVGRRDELVGGGMDEEGDGGGV